MKKILLIVVASIAFLTLSACSSDEKGMDSQSQSSTSVQSLVAVGRTSLFSRWMEKLSSFLITVEKKSI